MEIRKTKILITIGKNSSSKEVLAELINAGVDGIRISTRFIRPDDRDRIMENLREAEIMANREICVILSLRESDIRIGSCNPETPIVLREGDIVHIASDPTYADETNVVLCNNREFPNLVNEGDKLIVEFGKLVLTVLSVETYTPGSISPEGFDLQASTGESEGPTRSNSFQNFKRYQRSKPKSAKSSKIVICKAENNCVLDNLIPVNFANGNILDPDLSNDMEDIRLLQWAGLVEIDIVVYKLVRGKDDLETL